MGIIRTILGRPGLGCRSDAPDPRDQDLTGLGLPGVPPSSATLRHAVVETFDQGGTNSCVGQAIAQAVRMCWVLYADPGAPPPPRPAAQFVYFNSRASHGEELYDRGTYVRSGFKELIRFGVPEEQYCPFSPWKINRRPPHNAYRMAFDRRGPRGYYRIAGFGQERLDGIRRAIASGRPVVFNVPVSWEFTALQGPSVETIPRTKIAGRHAMVVAGYDGALFEVVSSWGAGWRDGGGVWLTEDYMAWDDESDVWAVDYGQGPAGLVVHS